jgi:cytochrome c
MLVLLLASCNGRQQETASVNVPSQGAGDTQRGKAALERYGCGSCHTIPGMPGQAGYGPSLVGIGSRVTPGGQPASRENLVLWITDPQRVAPGTVMPDLNVSDSDAQDIATYLLETR